jgi:hypothetical protein
MEAMSYVFPSDVDERPVSVIGGGTLGRRISVPEDLAVKKQVFRELDRLAEPGAIPQPEPLAQYAPRTAWNEIRPK